jgi:hypothetical protein
MNSLQSVALARIRLGDAVTALQSTANALEDALLEIRKKFPDIQNQPHEVAIARAELNRATAVQRVLAEHVNAGLARLGGEPQVRRGPRNIMERV